MTQADGTVVTTELTSGHTTTTLATGTIVSTEVEGDPRFGMQAPLAAMTDVQTGSLPPLEILRTRSVQLADDGEPSSLEVLDETIIINGRETARRWDVGARTATLTSPEGRRVVWKWDEQGRATEVQVGSLLPRRLAYDGQGRVSSFVVGQRETRFEYGDDGYLSRQRDALGNVVSFTRDRVGRIIQITSDDAAVDLAYDQSSFLETLTPPGREPHRFEYLPGDLLRAYEPPPLGPLATSTTYAYDADEALTLVTQPGDRVIDLEYDPESGKLTRATLPDRTLTTTYDDASGRLSGANLGTQGLSYTYDGELLSGLAWSGDVSGSVAWSHDENFWAVSEQIGDEPATAFEYDDDGLLVVAGAQTLSRDPEHGFVVGTTLETVIDYVTYSAFGEPESYVATAPGGTLYSTAFERDALGRVSRLTETIEGNTHVLEYRYHRRGWLEAVLRDGQEIASYAYDENGNRTAVQLAGDTLSATFDAQDRLEQQGDTSYTYALYGELAQKQSPRGTTRYEYDALGNLLTVTLPSGTVIDYVVDAQGRRVGKKVGGTLTRAFLYRDALQPVAELDAQGKIETVFVYASRAHVPDHMTRGSEVYRIVSDFLGSPRLVVNAATGDVMQRMDYDAWGNVIADTNPGFQPFGFAGGLYDADTGLVRFGARDYDPHIGRWTARDPILFRGGDANLYAYVGNDPINFVDPSGLYTEVTFWAPVGYGSSSFGHVSVDINGTTYSFAPGGMTEEATSAYLARNTAFRSGRGLILNLTPEQEAELAKRLSGYEGEYDAFSNNCTDPAESGLADLGLPLSGDSLLPTGLAQNLINNGLAIGQAAHVGPSRPPLAAPWTNAVRGSWWNAF